MSFIGALSVERVLPAKLWRAGALVVGLVRFEVGGRCTPECGPETCQLQNDKTNLTKFRRD